MHEIRTPCHEICSSAEQLLETVIMSDDDAVEVRQVKASSIRLSDVLEDMADTVMFERNMVPKIDNVPFDLRAALQQVCVCVYVFVCARRDVRDCCGDFSHGVSVVPTPTPTPTTY